MRTFLPCLILFAVLATPAGAATTEKRVYKVDGVIASTKNGRLTVEVKGAVPSGGWRQPKLHILRASHPHTLTLELLAAPPPTDAPVIEGLVPIQARLATRAVHGVVAVEVQADVNAITTQILH
jgi:hypothetical protein